jgi:hypothetical protein
VPGVDNARVELRPELCAPAVPSQRIAELCAAIDRIEELLQNGDPADGAIAAFNAETGHEYAMEHFHCYWESYDIEDFALEAARPAWPKVPDVTREELMEIVRRIVVGDLKDQAYYLHLLDTNVVHPGVVGLIFHPPAELVGASPERIVDATLSYRPIAL